MILPGTAMAKSNGEARYGAESTTSAVSLRDASKRFSVKSDWREAVRSVSLDLQCGDFVSIVGPTGCGKTTLLKMIAGFEQPSTGSVLVFGRPATEQLGPRIGYLFQKPNLFPWLRIRDNVQFAARYARVYGSKGRLEEETDEWMNALGIGEAGALFPYEASGGMRSRAAIARVLLARPELLLMDEPFSALDALTRAGVHVLIKGLLRGNDTLTTVLITHDINEALVLSQRVLVMSSRPGAIVAEVACPFGKSREDLVSIEGSAEFGNLKRDIIRALASNGQT